MVDQTLTKIKPRTVFQYKCCNLLTKKNLEILLVITSKFYFTTELLWQGKIYPMNNPVTINGLKYKHQQNLPQI